jgi:predicted nucleic acid-binding protein
MEVILDTSAIIAVIAGEPEKELVIHSTKNAVLFSPDIISFEVSNALTRMMRKKIIDSKVTMINLIRNFRKMPIKIVETDIEKMLEIAWDYKIYAYDACYLEIAKRLHFPLLTFDTNMKKVGKELGLEVLGG